MPTRIEFERDIGIDGERWSGGFLSFGARPGLRIDAMLGNGSAGSRGGGVALMGRPAGSPNDTIGAGRSPRHSDPRVRPANRIRPDRHINAGFHASPLARSPGGSRAARLGSRARAPARPRSAHRRRRFPRNARGGAAASARAGAPRPRLARHDPSQLREAGIARASAARADRVGLGPIRFVAFDTRARRAFRGAARGGGRPHARRRAVPLDVIVALLRGAPAARDREATRCRGGDGPHADLARDRDCCVWSSIADAMETGGPGWPPSLRSPRRRRRRLSSFPSVRRS